MRKNSQVPSQEKPETALNLPVTIKLPPQAYAVLAEVEAALAVIANREERVDGQTVRLTTLAAASKRAKLALSKLQALAEHVEEA